MKALIEKTRTRFLTALAVLWPVALFYPVIQYTHSSEHCADIVGKYYFHHLVFVIGLYAWPVIGFLMFGEVNRKMKRRVAVLMAVLVVVLAVVSIPARCYS